MQNLILQEQTLRKLKERFCKDFNIPIKIFEEPYFNERLNLFAKLRPEILSAYDNFIDELQKYPNHQNYFEYYNKIQNEAIEFIKNTPEYQTFNETDMNQFAKNIPKGLPSKDIYRESNTDHTFISIDMKQANFNALRHYCQTYCNNIGIFGNEETWENFMSKFTDSKHIINSKYIRQVILGNCNPKRQITYEKYIMSLLLEKIKEHFSEKFYQNMLVFFSNDEIIFDVTDTEFKELIYHRLQNLVETSDINVPFKVQLFKLQKIQGTDGFIKKGENFIEPKCIDAIMYPMIIRKIFKETIKENDKVFLYNGFKAKLIDIPDIQY